jgi:hypothetical protein
MRHALPLVLLRLALDVEAELIVELLLEGAAREHCTEAIPDVAQHLRIRRSSVPCAKSSRASAAVPLALLQVERSMQPFL